MNQFFESPKILEPARIITTMACGKYSKTSISKELFRERPGLEEPL
jgi:hypothetical protein